ncbi:MAG: hypothetical protein KDA65_12995 [Planctomycetaceae bacterium]|nr:hypothetical protein [Planctomycetaceae bacterium]
MSCPMVSKPSSEVPRNLRVPRTDNSLLVEPGWKQLPGRITANQESLAAGKLLLLGKPEAELRQQARESLLQAAHQYLDSLGIPTESTPGQSPLFMGGHQPTLFHPGVWVKNFAIAELAKLTGGTAVNLVIDNDLAESTQFTYPDEGNSHLQYGHIDCGPEIEPQPWEELRVPSDVALETFSEQLGSSLEKWNVTPALQSVWAEACAKSSGNLNQAFTAARILMERNLGVQNLELPISWLSQDKSFLWFALHLLINIEPFRIAYNQQLAAYRQRNKIRNQQHPVPDLEVNGEWQEVPFWIWRKEETQRHHVWIKLTADQIILSDGKSELATLPHPKVTGPETVIAALTELDARNIRFRPRALTTTLYARLFLCDLFVHGIGGAKYDEVTDDLLREFYQQEPPTYLALSGTIWFPTGRNIDVTSEEIDSLKEKIRDLKYHPADHLSAAQQTSAQALLAEREHLLAEQNEYKSLNKSEKKQATEQNQHRFQRLKGIARELTILVEPEQARLKAELKRLESLWEERQVQVNREYPALFYPAEKLEAFMEQLRKEIRRGFSST